MAMAFPLRTMHMDFHTGPMVPDVGRDFDADAFADTLQAAHVDSVTVFAKCHHGHLYYDTDRPERHPGLPRDRNLLGEQVEALHRRSMLAPIYVSIQCDEYAANTHPEWIALDPDGRQVKAGGPLVANWQILDMSSPYQEYVAEQIAEVLREFAPVDGLFLDMCWDQPSLSKWAIDGMKRRGLDPREAADRARYAREVVYGYMERFQKMHDEAQRGRESMGVWFNSRPRTNLADEKRFLRHVEIECLPTGGWGYAYFPYVARYVRPFGMPTLSHTGRFHESWGDVSSLKPEAALLYECCLILSAGMSNGIGDQMHPRGTLEKPAYDMIGRVYGHIAACEPYVVGGEIRTEAAVLINPDDGDQPGAAGLGIIRALQQLRIQFDLLPPSSDFGRYPLVIVPETAPVDASVAERLRAYLRSGGALIVSGQAALDAGGAPILPELGIDAHGPSPYGDPFLRPLAPVAAGLEGMDHVIHERGFQMTAAGGAEVLCELVDPYFERTYEHFCSHRQTPEGKVSRYAAVVRNGNAITYAHPIFTAYGRHGNLPNRDLLRNCIALLLPQPLVRDGGPAHLETSVVRKDVRTVVHLISFCPVRRTEHLDVVEDPFPLVEMPLSVRLDRAPRRAFLAPQGVDLPFEYRDGRAEVKVTCLDGHTMVVFE